MMEKILIVGIIVAICGFLTGYFWSWHSSLKR